MAMKNALLVCCALLAGFGFVLVKLSIDLRAERQASSALRAQLAGATPPAAASVAPPQVQPAVASAAAGACAATPAKPAPTPSESDVAMRATSTAMTASLAASLTGSSEQDLLKDPEYRKAQLTITRLRLAQNNPGLADTLGISDKEASKYFEVMAEQQLKLTQDMAAVSNGGIVDAKAMDEVLRKSRDGVDPLRAAMGEAKYAQYQEYQRDVRPALTQVASIGSALTTAGQPLSESQSRGLATAMMAEQQRQRQEAALPRANPGAPMNLANMLEESNKRQEESNRRILEASASYLSAAQQEVLRSRYEQQAAQRRKSAETAKQLDAGRVALPQLSPPQPPAPQ